MLGEMRVLSAHEDVAHELALISEHLQESWEKLF